MLYDDLLELKSWNEAKILVSRNDSLVVKYYQNVVKRLVP